MEMFVIVEWPDGKPPKLGSDLLYFTDDEDDREGAVYAAKFQLANPPHRDSQLNRLTVHRIDGADGQGAGAVWDSETADAQAPR